MKRSLIPILLACGLCLGSSCGVPSDPDTDDTPGLVDDDGMTDADPTSDDDGGQAATPCYEGTFLCNVGPEEEADCGHWEFSIDDNDSISGSGQVQGFADGPLDLTLSGTFNTLESVDIELTASRGDGGYMNLVIEPGTLTAGGLWNATDGIEPVGQTLDGAATGGFCSE